MELCIGRVNKARRDPAGAGCPRWCGWPGSAGASKNPNPSREGTHRAGSAPSPPLDLLAALDHPGHTRPRLPRVATAIERDHVPAPARLIELTINEFRRLFDVLLLDVKHTIYTLQAWSRWRRRHQAAARECHYRHHLQNQ
jgi:hypothetical protein